MESRFPFLFAWMMALPACGGGQAAASPDAGAKDSSPDHAEDRSVPPDARKDTGPADSGPSLITIASAQDNPTRVAENSTDVYWIDATTLMKAPLDGGTASTLASGAGLGDLALDSTSVYWTDEEAGLVLKMPLGGGAPSTLASDPSSFPGPIAVDAEFVYWTEAIGNVKKVPLNGGVPKLITSQGILSSIALRIGCRTSSCRSRFLGARRPHSRKT
jgi:hypothetical protein